MKKIKAFLIVLFMFIFTFSISGQTSYAARKQPTLKLNTYKATIAKGGKTSLKVKANIDGKVKWSSSKPSVASVSKTGRVVGKKTGTAVIKASIGNVSKTCTVNVVNLKVSSLNSWKKTYDSANDISKFHGDGVTYTITWGKVSGAAGYEICYYATLPGEPDGKLYKTQKKLKTNKFSDSFTHLDTTIKAKVRAYKKINGVTIYGPWSAYKTKRITYVSKPQEPKIPKATATFKSLRGKGFSYKSSQFSYGIGFGNSNNNVYIGVWSLSGTSSSYEDFLFQIKENQYQYRAKGMRSGYYYDISIIPQKDCVYVSFHNDGSRIFCNLAKYVYDPRASFVRFANY